MNTSAIYARAMRAMFVGLMLSICSACVGERTQRVTLQVPMASPIRALALSVTSSPDAYARGAVPAVERALATAGFQLVAPHAPHDATVQVDVVRGAARVAGGFLVVRGSDAGRLRLTFAGPAYPVEALPIAFVATEQWIEPDKVDRLVDALVRSPRVHQFAAATIEARALAARQAAERLAAERRAEEERQAAERRAEEERQRQARAAEASAWETANTPECAVPSSLKSCDGVQDYLAKYPEGWRSADARDLLQKAQEPLNVLRDDAAWAEVEDLQCAKPKDDGACDSVTTYLDAYPEGRHAARAQDLIKRAAPKLKFLRAMREAREAREAAAATADTADGGGSSGGAVTSGRSRGGGPVYVRGYTKKNGTYVRPHTRKR